MSDGFIRVSQARDVLSSLKIGIGLRHMYSKESYLIKNICILIVFILFLTIYSVSTISAAEQASFTLGSNGVFVSSTKHVAFGVLKPTPLDQRIYYKNKLVGEYVLDPDESGIVGGIYAATNKDEAASFVGKTVVLKGYIKQYPLHELRFKNGDPAIKECSLSFVSGFEFTDIIPAVIKQDNSIISVNAPNTISKNIFEVSLELKNPYSSEMDIQVITADHQLIDSGFPKNLALTGCSSPSCERSLILLPGKKKRLQFQFAKEENDIILEKAASKSSKPSVGIRVSLVGIRYFEQTGKTEVIKAVQEIYYLEKCKGRFEQIPGNGAILHTSFGQVKIDKWYIKKYGEVSMFDNKQVLISGRVNKYYLRLGSPLRSIEVVSK